VDYNEALEKVIKPGLALLPAKFDTPEARVMLLAIGMQESRFGHRKQIGGPAHGFFQFEKGGGVKGVLTHPATKRIVQDIIANDFGLLDEDCYDCLADEDYDALATVFARLLLYTDPHPLPALNCDPSLAWDYYFRNWRPGKPHRETWDAYLMHAREAVNGGLA
jgi:hypothetical protein